MSLYNFHPDRVALLDGYFLLREINPQLNIHNREIAEYVMRQVVGQVKFKPATSMKPSAPGAWLSAEDITSSWYWSKIHDKLANKTFALNVLLPNGRIIKELSKFDISSSFKDEDDIPYAASSDGMFFCLNPSLDERFLKFYDRHDYELTEIVKTKLVEDYSMPTPNDDGTYTYESF